MPVKRLFADPSFVRDHYGQLARVLAPRLGYDPEKLAALLKPQVTVDPRGRAVTNQYVNLRCAVSEKEWSEITAILTNLTFHPRGQKLGTAERQFYDGFRRYAIYAEDDQHRVYPSGRLGAHVLGYAQASEREFNNALVAELQGRDGIEAWFDEQLRGHPGWVVTETDALQGEIAIRRGHDVRPRPGLNVVLTLDMVVQQIVEEELAVAMRENEAVSVASVVLVPRTGEILAMATLPNYDPNDPGGGPVGHLRNLVIADQIEPGSTFKIVALAAALNEGLVQLGDTFDCERGRWYYGKHILKDHEAYGVMTAEEILMHSSNIGMAKIGLVLGKERLYRYMREFGFGSRTGVTLGAEFHGTVRPAAKWDGVAITRVPMGQGVAVTHLQMVNAMAALANRGTLMRPMLVSRLEDSEGRVFAQYKPITVRQVVTEETAALTVRAMKRVVSAEGTAPNAQLEYYTVAGKTGTAEKPGPGGYLPGKYVASFMGFFPADNPAVCISVVIDEPKHGYYGGRKAGPVFKRIAERVAQHLKIRPDVEPGDGLLPGQGGRDQFSSVTARSQ